MDIPAKGRIRDVSLIKLLVNLSRHRETGTLSLATPSFTKKIYLNQGDAIFASSNYPDDRLGEMLLKANKITVEQYDKSVELLKATKKRQGAILVECGYITPKDLFWGVKYQVKEIIQGMFQVEDGEYEFVEGPLPTQEVITLRMSMGNLIYDGVKRIENWTRIRNEMPDTDTIIRLSDDPLNLFQEIELSSQDKKILSLVNGRRSIKDVVDNSWMGSFEALKILYVLWSLGIVEQAPALRSAEKEKKEVVVGLQDIFRPASGEEEALLKKVASVYSNLKTLGMHELLEIDEKADNDAVKKTYYRLAKEFHPDRYFTIADESIKSKLTAIFDSITKSYEALRDEKRRSDYFRNLAAPGKPAPRAEEPSKAEEQFRRGVEDLKKGNFWGAVENFKWATNLQPKVASYWNYLSLAYSKVPGKLKEAEEAILTAIKLEPFNSDLYTNMGLIYMKAGLRKRAYANFVKALKIDPGSDKAKKGVEQTRE